jgi:hypothetical protein
VAKWQNGKMAKWQNGKMAKWQNGTLVKKEICKVGAVFLIDIIVMHLAKSKTLAAKVLLFPNDFHC